MSQSLRDRRVRHAQLLMKAAPAGLLAEAGDLAGRDVLVLGHSVGETMCELTMTECRSVESRAPGCRVDPRSVDVVLVANVTDATVRGVVDQAIAALSRGGRLVVRLPRTATRLAHEVRSMLALAGFDAIRELQTGADRVVSGSRLAVA